MNQSITRRMAVAWPAALLIALALHSSGRAEANNGLSAYASPVQKYALALEAQTQGDYPAMLTWLRAAPTTSPMRCSAGRATRSPRIARPHEPA